MSNGIKFTFLLSVILIVMFSMTFAQGVPFQAEVTVSVARMRWGPGPAYVVQHYANLGHVLTVLEADAESDPPWTWYYAQNALGCGILDPRGFDTGVPTPRCPWCGWMRQPVPIRSRIIISVIPLCSGLARTAPITISGKPAIGPMIVTITGSTVAGTWTSFIIRTHANSNRLCTTKEAMGRRPS